MYFCFCNWNLWAFGIPTCRKTNDSWICFSWRAGEWPTRSKRVALTYIFFFFHWHYNPLWVLARRMSFFFPICHQLFSIFSLPELEDLFLLPLSIFSWVFPFFSSLPVLEWRSFWASYPPPFSLGDLTSLSFLTYNIIYKINVVLLTDV